MTALRFCACCGTDDPKTEWAILRVAGKCLWVCAPHAEKPLDRRYGDWEEWEERVGRDLDDPAYARRRRE